MRAIIMPCRLRPQHEATTKAKFLPVVLAIGLFRSSVCLFSLYSVHFLYQLNFGLDFCIVSVHITYKTDHDQTYS